MSWVVPGLVNSLGRSSWKTLDSSPFFLLQKNEPARAVKNPPRPFRVVTARFPHYKIAEADDAESLTDAMSFLAHNILPQIEGKKTSKKIAKWLKLWHAGLVKIDYTLGSKDDDEGHEDISTSADETDLESEDCVPAKTSRTWYTHRNHNRTNATQRGPVDPLHLRDTAIGTESGFPHSLLANRRESDGTRDSYHSHDAQSGPSHYENVSERGSGSPVESPTEGNDSSSSMSGDGKETAKEHAADYQNHQRTRSDASSVKIKSRPRTTSLPTAPSASIQSRNDFSSIAEHTIWSAWANMPLESLQHWVGIPPEAIGANSARNTAPSVAVAAAGLNKNTNRARAQENLTFFEIPFHFVTLLSYPEDDTLPGSRPPFHVLREIALVRQRRIILLGLSLFTLLLRFSSPDFFCVLLALCNWVGLYLLKNSRKVNVTLAKRSVRQRVGWAKQWANGLFWRRGQAQPNNPTVNAGNVAAFAKQGTTASTHQLNEEKPKGYVLGNLHGGLRPPSDGAGKSTANSNPSANRLILRAGNSLGQRTGRSFDTVGETAGMKSRFHVHVHPSYYNTDRIKTRSTVAGNEAPSTLVLPNTFSPLDITSSPISPPFEFFPSSASQRRSGQTISSPKTPTSGTAPPSGSSSASTSSSPGAGPQTDHLPANPSSTSTSTRRGGFFRKAVETRHFQLVPSVSIPNSNATDNPTSTVRPTSPSWSDVNSTSTANLSAIPADAPHDFLSDPTMTARVSTTKRRFFLSRRSTRIQNRKPVAPRSNVTSMGPIMPDHVGKNLELSDFPPFANYGHQVSAIQENGGEVHGDGGELQEKESESGHRREVEKSKEKEEKRKSGGGLWRLRRSSVGSAPERTVFSPIVPMQSSSTAADVARRQLQVSNENRKVSTDLEITVNADSEGDLKSKLSPTISGRGIRLAIEGTENKPPTHDTGHSQRAHAET